MEERIPLKFFISKNSVVNEETFLGKSTHSPIVIDHEPLNSHPVIPFIPWCLHFDQDIMVALQGNDGWGMIEVSKIYLPNGEVVWFTLDSRLDGLQYIGLPSHISEIAKQMLSAFSRATYDASLKVSENYIKGKKVVEVDYSRLNPTNNQRDPIKFCIKIGAKKNHNASFYIKDNPPFFRNGNAMNHSQNSALAILDLTSVNLTNNIIFSDPKDIEPYSIFGLKVAGLMSQSCSGILSGAWFQSDSTLENEKNEIVHDFELEHHPDKIVLRTKKSFPSYQFVFNKVSHNLQLREISCHQNRPCEISGERKVWNQNIFKMKFNPSLPDLRFGKLPREIKCNMVTEVNGKQGYQCAHITFTSKVDKKIKVSVESLKPKWAMQRVVTNNIDLGLNKATHFSEITAKDL